MGKYRHTSRTDGHASAETFAMQPGSPRIPCIHSMHGVGCRLPVIELLTTGTLSPAVYHGAYIYIYTRPYKRTANEWLANVTSNRMCMPGHIPMESKLTHMRWMHICSGTMSAIVFRSTHWSSSRGPTGRFVQICCTNRHSGFARRFWTI